MSQIIKISDDWMIYGKLPITRDYFQLGPIDSVNNALVNWMANGYSQYVNSGHKVNDKGIKLRFYSVGKDDKTFTAGLLKFSSDDIGRPFPIMVTGPGKIESWKKHWHRVMKAEKGLWITAESLIKDDLTGLHDLKIRLENFQYAVHSRFIKSEKTLFAVKNKPTFNESLIKYENGLWQADLTNIINESDENTTVNDIVEFCCNFLKEKKEQTPRTVFVSENKERTQIFVFSRALTNKDFLTLWKM